MESYVKNLIWFFQRSERRTVSWFSNTRRDTRSVIYFLTVGKAREVASVTCTVLTFHHHTDDPVDGGRNIVERHTLVNPVTVSRDVVNNKGFAVNAHPYRKQQKEWLPCNILVYLTFSIMVKGKFYTNSWRW